MSELLPIIFTTIWDLSRNMSGMLGFRVYPVVAELELSGHDSAPVCAESAGHSRIP
jgi:hypothetical protein